MRQLVRNASSEWCRENSLDTPMARNDVVITDKALIMHAINDIFSSIRRNGTVVFPCVYYGLSIYDKCNRIVLYYDK